MKSKKAMGLGGPLQKTHETGVKVHQRHTTEKISEYAEKLQS